MRQTATAEVCLDATEAVPSASTQPNGGLNAIVYVVRPISIAKAA